MNPHFDLSLQFMMLKSAKKKNQLTSRGNKKSSCEKIFKLILLFESSAKCFTKSQNNQSDHHQPGDNIEYKLQIFFCVVGFCVWKN